MALTVWNRLNLKDQDTILVLNAPDSFEPELADLRETTIRRRFGRLKNIDFVLAFVLRQRQVVALAKQLCEKTSGDAVVWCAYPKKTSKRYTCDVDRDRGWKSLGDVGFEGVRQIAIDEDWSALRFRRVEFIKSMSRQPKRAITRQGRAKTQAN